MAGQAGCEEGQLGVEEFGEGALPGPGHFREEGEGFGTHVVGQGGIPVGEVLGRGT